MSLDYLNNKNSKLKAIGCCIFCGSASIGTMKSGFNVDRVLEISDDMVNQNAYHFIKNFKDVPIITPSTWENDEYLESLKNEKYDLFYSNVPCSGLSSINRMASADNKVNVHFYRVFDAISKIQPKVFLIENAPTLIKLGFPIIKDLTKILGKQYRFTILRDCAGNHNIAMKRTRTMIVGWNRNEFDKIPELHANKQPLFSVKDAIGDLYNKELNSIPNHNIPEDAGQFKIWNKYSNFIPYAIPNNTLLIGLVNNYDSIHDQFDEKLNNKVSIARDKLNNNKKLFDKSPYMTDENYLAPSLTSLAIYIHPTNNRFFTTREYARLMGYPDDFILYDGECKTPTIQCLAQGVPVDFFQYITTEIKEVLFGNRQLIDNSEDKIISFEHHIKMARELFTQEQINSMAGLDTSKNAEKMKE